MAARESLQHLETALTMREEAAYKAQLARYAYEQLMAESIVQISQGNDINSVAMMQYQVLQARAALDPDCVAAFRELIEAEHQHHHAEDTVTMILEELKLLKN